MRILSLFIGQDTSVSIIEDGKLAYFMPEERLSRKKDDYFWTNMMRDVFLNFDKHYDIVNLAYDLNEYYCIVKEVKKYIERFFEYKDLVIHDDRHHDFHALGGFYTSPFQEALCVVVDGGGSLYRKNESIYMRYHPYDLREIESVYFVNKTQEMKTLFKHYYSSSSVPFSHRYTKELKISTNQWGKKEEILKRIREYVNKTGVKNVVLTGGYAADPLTNYFYLKNLKDINVYIDPLCSDAGLSVGISFATYLKYNNSLPQINLPYICGGNVDKNYNFDGLKSKKCSYEDVIDLILDEKNVFIFQGKGECIPIGLGNRSLLCDPRRDIVKWNGGGTVMLEYVNEWFEIEESQYMQYEVNVKREKKDQIPALVSSNNTCRIQTLSKNQNKHYYNLIKCFYQKTGVPILMNAPFTFVNEPLVQTFHHAIHTLKRSTIEYLYLPELKTLITTS